MVFGDNVRARMAARALPRTPTQRGRERTKERQEDKTSNENYTPITPITPPPFHNPQHNTTKQDKTRQDKTCTVVTTKWYADSILPTPPAFLPNANHHRHSTMTQPRHKDTALNQQCCNNEHKEEEDGKGRREEERDTTIHNETTHTTTTHTTVPHSTTRQQQHDSNATHTTALPYPQHTT